MGKIITLQDIEAKNKPEQLSETEILNEDDRIFKSWGSVEIKDRDGELLPIDEFKKIMPLIMKRGGNLIDSHSNRVIGKILNYEFKTNPQYNKEGVLLTCQIFDDYELDNEIWEGIKKGEYTGLSFGGRNKIEEIKFEKGMDTTKILRGLEGYEFSVVKSPANQGAVIQEVNYLAKGDIQKPFAGFKDFDACVLEMSKKYDEETAKKVCGKLQAEFEKIKKEFEKNNNSDDKIKENQLTEKVNNLSQKSEKTEKYLNAENNQNNMEQKEITKEEMILKEISELKELLKGLLEKKNKEDEEKKPEEDEEEQKKKVKKEETETEETSNETNEETSDETETTEETKEEENEEKSDDEKEEDEGKEIDKEELKKELIKEIKKELNFAETPKPQNEKYLNKENDKISLPKNFAEANKLVRELIK